MTTTFMELLKSRWEKGRFLCIGLDSDFSKLPEVLKKLPVKDALLEFNRRIVEATAEYACAFKPNIAFYEGYGLEGLEALIETNRFIREQYSEIPIILDAKRADIGSTNLGYVRAVIEVMRSHAVTVHPYLGQEALRPFLERADLGVIVLCQTSNPGAVEFQHLKCEGKELYKTVAAKVSREWNYNHNCGLVVGATYPEQVGEVRDIAGDIPFLIPGIGAQGGELERTILNGLNSSNQGIIINSSRGIIYASAGPDFDQAAGREATALDCEIRKIIERKTT